ncbi:ATP-dependent zinc metalloprotease FtsH [Pseudoduganella flava]|nr:ATP-dependent zinc metalloprotease FtsH [Pseudoduganella flava]
MFLMLRGTPGGTVPYSEFKTLLAAGKVADVVVGSADISGQLNLEGLERVLPAARAAALRTEHRADRTFITRRIDDPDLVSDLETAGVTFDAAPDRSWLSSILIWTVPLLLMAMLWNSAARKLGGGLTGALEIGKSRARVYMQQDTGVTFDDIAGIDEARDELIAIVQFLKNPERYRRLGGRIPKGVLIVGAPGTGKTLLAKAVAGEAGVPFFSISGAEFVEMFVGVGAARVRDLFAQAEDKAPCIIFIDELDALGKARGVTGFGGHDEREQTLNQLLVEMDGFASSKAVIIMAATNRPEILDPALLRAGRFDRHIALDRPDLKGRTQILAVHAKKVVLAADVDLAALAGRTAGFAGADLANLVNEAALLAARQDQASVTMSDFDKALDRIVAGIEKKSRVMNRREKETVAWHEAGHALIAELRPGADRVTKISIIPRGIGALGHTQQTPAEERYLLRRSELLDRLDVLLGGRVAEELAFGDVSTGAQNDLQRATGMAHQMVAQFGMSSRIGLASYEHPAAPPWWNGGQPLPAERGGYSERTAREIDDEVRTLLQAAHARVRDTLRVRRPTLDALARRLLDVEVVDRTMLTRLIEEGARDAASPPPAAQPERPPLAMR